MSATVRVPWRRGRSVVLAAVVALLAGLLVVVGAAGVAQAATVDPNAWYVLVNRNSGKAMDVSAVSTSDGAQIQQWTRHDGANQQWQFVDSGGGFYRLRARHSGKVLDVFNFSTADGANIVQWADGNGTNQQFRLADSPDGFVRLINRNSGKAVEVQGASTADGARVVQFADGGGANQQWRLVPLGDAPGGALPSTFRWSSSGVLAGPKPDAQHPNALAVKDFSVTRHNNQWLIYATTASPSGWGLVFYSFADWPQAASATHTYLDTASAIGPGYRAAPQLFFFAPQNLWYLVYQTGPPTYSTSTNPADPRSWSAPRTFIAQEPPIVTQNKGPGQWIDFWVICDGANCFLFFSDDNGHIYRAQTSQGSFPNGFGNTQIVLSDSRFALFEATNVYKVAGNNQYLLLQEAIGSDGRRWFRSYTSTSLTGSWAPLANTESNPFARSNNVTFPNGQWTRDISHGDLIRANNDQTQTINPCRLQYVYQGMDPNASGEYIRLPWRMGLLTQTNSTC
ncbi:MAG TPA: non-reducing end alpha-L-arabinofuranosidase family hydrolase [Actinophytocola sp.]|uniref:non-reducing end alpha-L-arabinofuranosidase family hydrolase n=1 Tax=Actinophytocola sp. TaxID=1872138 RepID=UPI002DDCA1D3|nr:non-reducing end alpha-L-arabinofuranosidase family hydrolase [Actinophytocola sp.]HEV2782836.1 non-reducing end alpha-L-arabinofuranosidase family hydrolase [Actinophytocola sp.]